MSRVSSKEAVPSLLSVGVRWQREATPANAETYALFGFGPLVPNREVVSSSRARSTSKPLDANGRKRLVRDFVRLIGKPADEWLSFIDEQQLALWPSTHASTLPLGNIQNWALAADGLIAADRIIRSASRWRAKPNPAEAMLAEMARLSPANVESWIPAFAKGGTVHLNGESYVYELLPGVESVMKALSTEMAHRLTLLCSDSGVTVRASVGKRGIELAADFDSLGGAIVGGITDIIGAPLLHEAKKCAIEKCQNPVGNGQRLTCSIDHSTEWRDSYWKDRRPKQGRPPTGRPPGRPRRVPITAEGSPSH